MADGERTLCADLEEFRRRIDELDEQLVRLFNARAACALEVGRLKDRLGLETYQPERELEVLNHARSVNGGPLDAGAITRLFERIIDEARRLERLAQIAKSPNHEIPEGDGG
jgi:chorismate mutase